ncbi:MAG: polymerase subunit gamma/tau [Actinomycetota bacterium]|nr:polymerase subunit gamma/tau [Actinomycetota bacterium]
MAYISLYRKYRSQTFDELIGQEHVSRTLKNALAEDKVAHAYLFTGPRGTGKTSTARILAKALNCVNGPTPEPCGVCDSCVAITDGSSLDVFELDAASHSGVDETREILSGVNLATAGGKKKVYVIDEVHMLTTQSFNALLKTLEEPPSHVVFVLATTDPHKVLSTIVSRTQRFDFRRITVEALEAHLADIAKREKIKIDPDALTVIARHAEGSARDALSALDQLSSLDDQVTVDDAEKLLGDRDDDALVEVFDAVADRDVGSVFTRLHSLVAQGSDPRQLAFTAMEHARALLLVATAPDAGSLRDVSASDRAALSLQAQRFTPEALVRLMDLLGKAITEMRNAPNHRLLLEVALVRAAAPETDPTAGGLLGRIERLERRIGIEGPPPEIVETPAPKAAPKKAPPPRAVPQHQAPPAEPAPSAPATPAAIPAQVGLGDIKESWAVALEEVKKMSRRVAAMLSPSRPLSFTDGKLEVEVQSGFHADEMAEAANRSKLSDALHAALGVRPDLVFTARGMSSPEPLKDDLPDISEATVDSTPVQDDPIELVRKGLGAEVVEEKTNS